MGIIVVFAVAIRSATARTERVGLSLTSAADSAICRPLPRSWSRTFLDDPRGVIQVGTRKINVRAVQTRSKHLKDAVDRAYLQKYDSPGSIRFARDLGSEKSRATTIELVPLPPE